jgi:hypothetical protein
MRRKWIRTFTGALGVSAVMPAYGKSLKSEEVKDPVAYFTRV